MRCVNMIEKFVRKFNPNVCPIFALLVIAAAIAVHAWGQSPGPAGQLLHPDGGAAPSFEVATVKLNKNTGDLFSFSLQTARFKAVNAPLSRLIRFAYDVKSDRQVENMPAWATSKDYDIDAKISDTEIDAINKLSPDRRFDQYRLMVQSLLADRFQMKVRTTTQDLPIDALVAARSGPQLTPTPELQTSKFPQLSFTAAGDLKAASVSMAFFAGWLSGKPDTGGRIVVDATGLNGRYDFSLHYDPVASSGAANGNQSTSLPPTDADKPPLLSAIQEQLGLKLESRKAPVEVLVIDHVEQPSPN